MEKIWHHTFYQELKQEPEEHPIMLTEIPMNPKYNRERMTQIMFETFNVPAMYVQIQAVLSSYASGLYNGIVVELGDSVSHIVPIFEGNSLPHSILRSEIAGKSLNDYLVKLFQERGHTFTTSAEMEIVRNIKEKLSFVTLNYEEDMRFSKESSTLEKPYELPDGTSIIVGSERFRCPEPLFRPSLIGKDTVGIGQMTYFSIQNCDSDLWSQLYRNIIISGGTSMFVGLEERLTVEVSKLAPQSMWVKVFGGPNRKFGA